MQKGKVLYTVISVLALILVVLGIVFAWRAYDTEVNNKNENTLSN